MNPSIIWSGLSPANRVITNKRISLKRILCSIQSGPALRRILRLKQRLWRSSPPRRPHEGVKEVAWCGDLDRYALQQERTAAWLERLLIEFTFP